MQTATAYYHPHAHSFPTSLKPQPVSSPQEPPGMNTSLRMSVSHFLSRAYMLPCSAAAQAFNQIVQPTARFQLALDVLFPLLDSNVETQKRILVSYILYSLYAPHPITMNPFKSALVSTFAKEKEQAVRVANAGAISENEQLIWVLWKILRGDGNDIAPFTPSNLATSPLPPKLRASNLSLEGDTPPDRPKFDPFGPPNGDGLNPVNASINGNYDSPQISPTSAQRDRDINAFSDGMSLILAARDRVLTLSEQRTLTPLIPHLAESSAITSIDLAPIISTNPAIAQPLLVALLVKASSTSSSIGISPYLEVLRYLPPTLPSFDLIGRLLRDATVLHDVTTGGRTTVADLVRSEALGWFIHEAIAWLDHAEQDELEGVISDDRFAKGLQNLCRFFNSLIKVGIIDPASDADSAEMAHFTLRNSRFEDANALYRVLASGKF